MNGFENILLIRDEGLQHISFTFIKGLILESNSFCRLKRLSVRVLNIRSLDKTMPVVRCSSALYSVH